MNERLLVPPRDIGVENRTPFVGEQEAHDEREAKRHQEEDDRRRQALRAFFRGVPHDEGEDTRALLELNAELLGRWPK